MLELQLGNPTTPGDCVLFDTFPIRELGTCGARLAGEIAPGAVNVPLTVRLPVTVMVGTVSGPASVPPVSVRTFANALFNCCAVRI